MVDQFPTKPAPDPASVHTGDELRQAVLQLIGTTSASAVARRAGVGESTIYAFRAGSRSLSRHTFHRLVEAYDAGRVEQWLAAWGRAAGPPPPARPAPVQAEVTEVTEVTDAVSRARPARGRRSLAMWASGVMVVLAVVAAAAWWGVRPAMDPAPGAAAGVSCPTPPLQTPAAVTLAPGVRQADVSIATMSYTYTPAYSPMIEIGGGLTGPLPEGQHLFLLAWADPASRDSTAGQNPGNGRYYPSADLPVTARHCFLLPRSEMGYGGFTGIRVRGYLALVPDQFADRFEREGNAIDGYTDLNLAASQAVLLGYFTVQTR